MRWSNSFDHSAASQPRTMPAVPSIGRSPNFGIGPNLRFVAYKIRVVAGTHTVVSIRGENKMHELAYRSRLDLQISKWYNPIPVQIARQKSNPTQSLTVESAAKGGVPVYSAYPISASVSSCAEFRALQAK